ncbi:hypothetical protein [Pedobacter hartonius]|uniref:DUF4402 domain-containing protein n=1 Tax=Pedobacter hartonius TaxID=425514 RepID=A0A1H4FMV0_9SPHI|nr:hypothetical protein [Pedobacter hartonius]SEA98471.1 hypothetical protein SAMN05443550_1087 [Pedobacter hartonius]
MKRNLLMIAAILAVFTLSNFRASAQVAPITSGNVPLSIILADAVTITLEAAPAVSFSYSLPTDYIGPRLVNKPTHFSIFSNRNYTLSVKADAAFQTPTTGPSIPLSAVNVAVKSSLPATGITPATVVLSTQGADLLTPAPATLGTVYSIDYTIPSSVPLLGVTAGTYTTNVIYTVTQL